MNSWIDFYQHIPEQLNPEIIRVGFFSIGWYAVLYAVAFVVVWFLLKKRLSLGEDAHVFKNNKHSLPGKQAIIFDFLLVCFWGAIIGGRLGYVFFYNLAFYWSHPLAIISPFDIVTGELIGIYGMSYHGGLIGIIFTTVFFVKKYQLNFWALTDFIIPAIPAGYFFGRLGNFLNGELYGRITKAWMGMYSPSAELPMQLRHPSQLYEAFLEGGLLFLILWKVRNKKKLQGNFLALYFIGYGLMRFLGEFFREPDAQIGFIFSSLSLGQLFSVGMIFCGIFLFGIKKYEFYLHDF